MELLKALSSRRSIRRFRNIDVAPDEVKALLEAAIQAPSAMNQQPWAFAVFQGRHRLAVIEKRLRRHLLTDYPSDTELPPKADLLGNSEVALLRGANVLVVIYATFGRLQPTEDCCLAAQNLMLAAHDRGFGTCPCGFARSWFDLAETKRELGISTAYTAVFPLILGYPDEAPAPTPRLPPKLLAWEFGA